MLEYNDKELIITNKAENQETRIPLNKINKLSLQPKYLSFSTNRSYNFKLNFINGESAGESLNFRAYAGKKLDGFIERIEKSNPDFVYNNTTWY